MAQNRIKALEDDPLWPAWERLRRLFPAWTLFLGLDIPRVWWVWWGNDLITGLRRNRSTERAYDLLRMADPRTLTRLTALAELNVRRHDSAFRFIALGYLTLPLGAAALAADAAPDALQSFYREAPELIWSGVVLLGLAVLAAFAGLWKARQMVSVLELARIELDPPGAAEPAGGREAELRG